MTPELTALTLAALLQVGQFALYSVLANLQIGTKTALGPRDEAVVLTGLAGRAQRAMNNHFEGLILFAIASVVVTLSETGTALTAACAYAYVVARVIYVPAYLTGANPWRSIIWFVGFGATVTLLLTAALAAIS